MKTDYKKADEVVIKSLPSHIQNLTLIGKQGVVHLNDPSEAETPLQVFIGGRGWEHLFYFEYENVEFIEPTDLLK